MCTGKKQNHLARIPNERAIFVLTIDYMLSNEQAGLSHTAVVMTESESVGLLALPLRRKENHYGYVCMTITNVIENVGYS